MAQANDTLQSALSMPEVPKYMYEGDAGGVFPLTDPRQAAAEFYEINGVEMISFRFPGDPNTNHVEKVDEYYRTAYAQAYAAYKANKSIVTPLEEVEWLDESQVIELKRANVRSLESLALMTDGNHVVGMLQLRDRAKSEIAERTQRANMSSVDRQADELKERDDKIADLTARLEALESKGRRTTK